LHRFRDTAATRWLRAGIDVRTVPAWLGHKTLATTPKYLEPSPDTEKTLSRMKLPFCTRPRSPQLLWGYALRWKAGSVPARQNTQPRNTPKPVNHAMVPNSQSRGRGSPLPVKKRAAPDVITANPMNPMMSERLNICGLLALWIPTEDEETFTPEITGCL